MIRRTWTLMSRFAQMFRNYIPTTPHNHLLSILDLISKHPTLPHASRTHYDKAIGLSTTYSILCSMSYYRNHHIFLGTNPTDDAYQNKLIKPCVHGLQ